MSAPFIITTPSPRRFHEGRIVGEAATLEQAREVRKIVEQRTEEIGRRFHIYRIVHENESQ